MNDYIRGTKVVAVNSFRPQQGLPIMNSKERIIIEVAKRFPSPTGVTYYEFKGIYECDYQKK